MIEKILLGLPQIPFELHSICWNETESAPRSYRKHRRKTTGKVAQRGSPGFQSIELRFPRELAATHIGGVTFHGLRHDIAQIAVATDEFGCPVEQPDHIVGDEDLAVAFRRRADSDGWHRDVLRDLVGEVGCHALDDNSEGPGLIGFARLGEHPRALRRVAPLGLEAALDIDRLRSQPDVTYNRDAAPGQEGNRVGYAIGGLYFDRLAAGFAHDPGGRREGQLAS